MRSSDGEVAVAVFGTFDVDNYGDHLFPIIAAQELSRRLPGVEVDAYSPFGSLHPTRLDGGARVSPLGVRTPGAAARYAHMYHAVLVGGGELLHMNDALLAPVYGVTGAEMCAISPTAWFVGGLGDHNERRCPVIWHAVGIPWAWSRLDAARVRLASRSRDYVTVRDPDSERRLADAGVRSGVRVVPDSALVVDRVYPTNVLDRQLDRLRSRGWYPRGRALLVQGCDLLVRAAPDVAAAVLELMARDPGLQPVVIETGRCRGDAQFADAVVRLLGRRTRRLPPAATMTDLAAAVYGAHLFAGSSLHGAITRAAYRRPFVLMNLSAEAKLDGFGEVTGLGRFVVHNAGEIVAASERALREPISAPLIRGLQHQVDRHFDRVADIAMSSASRRERVMNGDVRPAGWGTTGRHVPAVHLRSASAARI